MGSVDKEVEEALLEAGQNLLDPPSSIDELITLLDKIESCLSKVEQSPSESMHNALSPALKALIADKLLKHSDVDVKVALASCFSEITRITAPEAPYDDDQMKEVFRLIVSSFENLHDKSSRWHLKRTLILETVAKVRSCVVMLDLECDALILEMFQHFLKTIREHHPDNVFSSMETIMVLCLEESEDISLDLLSPILESVKKDNEEALPIARKLGERVLESCATRLKPYLMQAVNTLGISLDDYSDVLASLCNDSSDNSAQNDVHDCKSAEEPVEESAQVDSEITKEATPPPQQDNDADGDRSPKSVMSNGITQAGEDDTLVESKPLKEQDGTDSPVLSKGNNLSVNEERNDLDTEIIDSKEQKLERSTKRKGKKASSSKSTKSSKRSNVVSEKEAEKTFDSVSPSKETPSSLNDNGVVEATGTSENDKEIKVTISSPKVGDVESDAVVSHSPSESNHDENRSKKRVRTKKKDSSVKEVTAGHISKKVSEGTCDSEVKSAKPSAKKGLDRSSDVKVTTVVDAVKKGSGKSEERTKGDGGSSLRKLEDKKKKGHVKGSSEKGLAKSSSKDEDKIMVSSLKSAAKTTKDEHSEETPKTNLKRKRTPGKEKVSGIKKNDQKLVGKRVKVLWPEDDMFYEGVVHSFDSSSKKHKVLYDDGDEEILNLDEEKWEIVEADTDPDVEEGSHHASPDPSTDMPLKKKGKTNAGESKKEGKNSSKSGGAPSSKSKTPSNKSTQKSKTVGKSDGEVSKKSKDSAQKTGDKFEDRYVKSGGQSEERSVKSGGKSIDSTQKNNSKKTDGSKIKKSKDDDVDTPKPSGSKIKKSKDDDVDTLKPSANSKQETVKTGKSKQGTSKTVEDDDVDTPMPSANSKQETVKTGKSKHGTSKIASSSKPKSTKTTGKVKFNLTEDSENENSEDSTKEVEDMKVKTPSSLKAGSVIKSGKKRARN
ncbi:unnamed protein product [Vicia faba]|uniref:PTM/DIR17-like Tudor domain-containing protein n=1 Tax=Vicia faba TaxID=3906 RepID=A0AAV1A7M3_VICFA|nr:unnamed protein product [Vicia faba]